MKQEFQTAPCQSLISPSGTKTAPKFPHPPLPELELRASDLFRISSDSDFEFRTPDGRAALRSGLAVTTSLPAGDDTPIIDFIASDETLDRYGEIIVASGWRLENFRKNPVFQNAHQYGDVLFTLGKALITEVRPMGASHRPVLFQRIEFAVEANPMARIAYGLYRGKFLNAVSVGFIPIRWETGSAEAGYRRKYLEQELLEVSAVAVPANPAALQLALRTGYVRRGDLLQAIELLAARVTVGRRSERDPNPEIRKRSEFRSPRSQIQTRPTHPHQMANK